jgi:hypothetical protein
MRMPSVSMKRYDHEDQLALTRFTTPAHAFRCGTKIVAKDMHEAQARQACGAPTTMRNINMPIETLGYGYRESVDYAA